MESIARQINTLRAIADWLAAHQPYLNTLPSLGDARWGSYTDEDGKQEYGYLHPEIDELATYVTVYTTAYDVQITVHGPNAKNGMAAIRRNLGGKWEKAGYGDVFTLRQTYEHFTVDIDAPRKQVCHAIQTGTRTVKKRDPEALLAVPEIEVEEPVIEWECDPLLVGEGE